MGCMWATVYYQKPTGPMCSADSDVMSCLHMAELCDVEKKPWTSVIHIIGLELVVFAALFALPFLRWYITAISNL